MRKEVIYLSYHTPIQILESEFAYKISGNPKIMMSFKSLNLINPIIRAVTELGYSKPTEIQYSAIPHIFAGKDIIGCAQTGTGKTTAFVMPILQLLKKYTPEHKEIRTLILTPTHKGAMQIEENFDVYSKYLPLSQLSIYGGVLAGGQLAALRKRVDILVATPDRLLYLDNKRHIDLSKIEILVLDEADRILNMGFVNDVKKILKLIPQKRQTLFFSATLPKSVKKFAESILNNPIEITITSLSSTLQTMKEPVYFAENRDQTGLLIDLLQNENIRRSLIFSRTKHAANKFVPEL
ncbi:ATP-dependent RNA helicase RhlE [Chryseobacterium ureilyticum]|uniref:ATP-dependent RNA helicase RhlE n=1 Tax=Chryseobacterium ureilyticum TaxID=373668 RepID=A0A1N7LBP4_9FLAO|nr:DEAD/DEAH box helicase [Chryseobacterium ureilyticum]SIS71252.1 ATP-dependent RNA helicase RhlE [Chryseobacterium ureilyticum]